jgi:hypothetical protein
MSVSDYQILNVIRTYVRAVRGRVDSADGAGVDNGPAQDTPRPDEGMKKIVFDRIGEIVTEKLRKHETE